MQLFMGTKLEKVNVLIDTQANGTALSYDIGNSARGILHHTQADKIEMPDGSATGFDATDQLCLDANEDICLEDFDFLKADDVNYPKVQNIKMGGVIPFNRYGANNEKLKGRRLIFDLLEEDVIFNMTMQLDLNPISGVTANDEEMMSPSYIHLNGIHKENIKYSEDDDNGVVYIQNHQDDGKWLISIDDATVNDESIFKDFSSTGCPAVLATALNSIKLPEVDFQAFESKFISDFSLLQTNGSHLWSTKPCSHLTLHNLTLSIGGLQYHIP